MGWFLTFCALWVLSGTFGFSIWYVRGGCNSRDASTVAESFGCYVAIGFFGMLYQGTKYLLDCLINSKDAELH